MTMMRRSSFFLVLPLVVAPVSAFLALRHSTKPITTTTTTLFYRDLPDGGDDLCLPTVQQVATQDFSDQVVFAARIVKELSIKAAMDEQEKQSATTTTTTSAKTTTQPPFYFANVVKPTSAVSNDESIHSREKDDPRLNSTTSDLEELLQVLLSHPDGMRGFFSAYLTATSCDVTTAADLPTTPTILMQALKRANLEELTPLLCMNLVVPAATIPWHADDAVLQQNTARVVQRAQRVMASLKGSINMVRHADAVLSAASQKTVLGADPKLVAFWSAVLDQYEYSKEQRHEIERAFLEIVSPQSSTT